MPADVTTIHDVELCAVGNWASALSGRTPIIGEDLDDMVAAAADTEVDHAPLKIGHVDPRFDGEPALGWLANVRRVGDKVVADLTDVPTKLAATVKHAFRRRSVEIAWGVKTPSGKQYRAALTGLALLGVTPPAVKGLADVTGRYSGPTNTAESRSEVISIDGDNSEHAQAQASALSAVGHYAAVLDGDPAQGRILGSLALLAGSGNQHPPVPDDLPRVPRSPSREDSVTDEQIREMFGLAADAPVTDQLRDAATKLSLPVDPPTPPAPPVDVLPPAPPVIDPVASPTVAVDRAALEELQGQAAMGAEAMRILNEQERDRDLASAMSGGKIAPASIEQYRALWAQNKEATKALLSSLPAVFSTVTNFSASQGADPAFVTGGDGHSEDEWKDFMSTLDIKGGQA